MSKGDLDDEDLDERNDPKGKKPPSHQITFYGNKIQLATLALTLVVGGVLFPAVRYSVSLSQPEPAQLLVAICIAIFSSVICLWLLSLVGAVHFEAAWASKAIWGAAIVSILGTGVGVFRGAFSDRKYPLEGAWDVRVTSSDQTSTQHRVILIHSETADTYYGFSDVTLGHDDSSSGAAWLEILDFDPDKGSISLRLVSREGKPTTIEDQVTGNKLRTQFKTERPSSTSLPSTIITLSRPK